MGDLARLTDPVLRRRARHVVADNQRVLDVVALLRAAGDGAGLYREIGRLLTQAHASLRDDFEISWPEADAAVEAAVAAGALGARMIGGGFGGSVLALVPDDRVRPVRPGRPGRPVRSVRSGRSVRDAVTGEFARRGWTAPEFLDAAPSACARRLA